MSSKQGRFGKYGETKRIERLRAGRSGRDRISKKIRMPKGFAASRGISARSANPMDAGFVENLSKKVFREFGPYDELLPKWFASAAIATIIAMVDKKYAGFAMLGRSFQEMPADSSELLAIAVEPSMQRMGIGDFLMREVDKKLPAEKMF